jgi:hypothetical protein
MVFLRSVRRLLFIVSVVPTSSILVTLMKEALSSCETQFLQEPHGVTFQKTPFFIATAVKTSNFTRRSFIAVFKTEWHLWMTIPSWLLMTNHSVFTYFQATMKLWWPSSALAIK